MWAVAMTQDDIYAIFCALFWNAISMDIFRGQQYIFKAPKPSPPGKKKRECISYQ